jgi:hypothetical protein
MRNILRAHIFVSVVRHGRRSESVEDLYGLRAISLHQQHQAQEVLEEGKLSPVRHRHYNARGASWQPNVGVRFGVGLGSEDRSGALRPTLHSSQARPSL